MSVKLADYLAELRQPMSEPSLEPDLDDVDLAKDKKLRELVDLENGAVRKGLVEQGSGTETPGDGDLVYFHLSVKREDGKILETTRPEEGGSAVPRAFVIGKGARAPRGWELALSEMLVGERAVFKVRPDYSYAQPGCKVAPPAGATADAALLLDIQLVNIYSKNSGVKVVGDEGDVFKRTLSANQSWETPRPPFEVEVALKARVPASNGKQGEGAPFWETPPSAPLRWTLGDGSVGPALEEGICAMHKGEVAILSCPTTRLACTGSRSEGAASLDMLRGAPQEAERLEFEAELVGMVQVRDLAGGGECTKRRVREGVGEFPIDCPLEDNSVRVHYRGWVADSGEEFVNTRTMGAGEPIVFDTGVNAVPPAIDMCVCLMTPQEVALVRCTPKYAYEGRDDRPAGCPEDAVVEFEIELLDFEKVPSWHHLDAAGKIERGNLLKEQGNRVFKTGQLRHARDKYLKALKILDSAFDIETDEEAEAASRAKLGCLLNLALIAQRSSDITDCFKWLAKALQEDPDSAKAYYRRASANAQLGNYEDAERDYRAAKELDPSSAAEIDREVVRMHKLRKGAEAKERREFANFFDRT